jgi:tRNA uracil 4-sulfurtransferase
VSSDAHENRRLFFKPVVVIRVHEVALKGNNRRWFMQVLRDNIAYALRDLGLGDLRSRSSRTFLELDDIDQWPEVRSRLAHVFGVANFSLALETRPRMRSIRSAIRQLFEVEGPPVGSFRVRARRANKRFPKTSPEIEREIGAYIVERTNAPVNLTQPDQTYRIEVLYDTAYVSSQSVDGPGGLPAGVSGRVVVLMSGGFDSPVAAYRMMKRGCSVTLLHCHAHPFVRATSIEKVIELARLIGRHQPGVRLSIVPIGEAQQEIAVMSEPKLRVVLYRRLMVRIATAVAREQDAGALVTGESLGQVSSQTLENVQAIGSATDLPVLRPLIGFDKNEIMDEARVLGTEAISRIPDDDCCTVFVPRHPTTHATVEAAERAEAALDIDGLVTRSLAGRADYDGDPTTWDINLALEPVGV